MGKVIDFLEFCKIAQGADGFAEVTEALGGETSDYIATPAYADCELYDQVVGICSGSVVVSTHVITLALYEATDTDGSGSTTISGKSTTYTSTDTDDEFTLAISVRAEELSEGYKYVGARATTDDADGSEGVCVTLLPMNPRYARASLIAAT